MIIVSKKQIIEFGIPKGCEVIRWLDESEHAWVRAREGFTADDLIRLNSWGIFRGNEVDSDIELGGGK